MSSKQKKSKKVKQRKRAPGKPKKGRKATVSVPSDVSDYKRPVKMSGQGLLSAPFSSVESEITHRFDELPPKMVGGKEITRYSGCAPVAQVVFTDTTAAGGPVMNPYGVGSGLVVEAIYINPTYIFPTNSPEYQRFATYTKYRLTKLSVMYNGYRASNYNGANIYGYYNDGSMVTGDVTSNTALFQPGSFISNVWTPCKVVDVSRYLDNTWYYIDYDSSVTASDADYRQSFQGAIFGVCNILPDTLPPLGQSVSVGQLWIEYELELASPRYLQDLANLESHEALRPYVYHLIKRQKEAHRRKIALAKAAVEKLKASQPQTLEELTAALEVELAAPRAALQREGKREQKSRLP